MPNDPHSVFGEPNFGGVRPAEVNRVDHEVWSEPCLMPNASPPDAALTYSGRLGARWEHASYGCSWLTVLGLACVAGPFAVLAALLKTSSFAFAVAAVVVAPLVEELGKVAAPLMTLERWPYRFVSGLQLVLVCAISGLVFASIENLLYLHVYVGQTSAAYAAWRWSVCTALHAGCSIIAGLGLRRVWLVTRTSLTRPDVSLAAPYFITAMMLHGGYNLLVLLFERSHLLSFGK